MDHRFCWVIVCLLGVGHIESGVSQSPCHYVTGMGRNVTLGCGPVPRRLYLFWYRQTPGKGTGFLRSIYNQLSSEKADFLKDHFSAEMPDGVCLTLKTRPAQLGASAMCLCAGSSAAALQRRFLPFHQLYSFAALPRLSASLPCPRRAGDVRWDCSCSPVAEVKMNFNLQKRKYCTGYLGLWYLGKVPRHRRMWLGTTTMGQV
ncbi:hypothetical protein J1605_009489 [Eschrichtius robustus]|uniref:Immunoglobulin V-set domain-containing protein n=1 Tax=Eschrichtius robustus TaxID=9764 RepID=A0AB34GTT0_ESCRO|nr:hypothetical protein J1605_009489 [Eschrichtius robustus]